MAFIQKQIESIFPSECTLGEGPLWVPEEKAVYWVDIKNYELHRLFVDTGTHKAWECADQITSLARTDQGNFIGTFRKGAGLFDIDEAASSISVKHIFSPAEESINNRFNDAKIDREGRLWAGSMDDSEQHSTGHLYLFDKTLKSQLVDSNYVITNGPAFSPDGRYMYHTDTLKREIYRFDFAGDGRLRNKSLFLKIPEFFGYPDGMTVDAEGCLWVCFFGGWGINRYTENGNYIGRVALPTANVTSCTFGGDDMSELFITTARKGLNANELREQPQAGNLFQYQTSTTGIASTKFCVEHPAAESSTTNEPFAKASNDVNLEMRATLA